MMNEKKYYENRQYVKTDLKKELILLISEQENILQKDVYLKFDSSLKNSISRVLSDMEKKWRTRTYKTWK